MMAIERFNSEGCGLPVATSKCLRHFEAPTEPTGETFDPITYEALTKIEKEERAARKAAAYRPLVYVCSPYSGDIERNTYQARAYSRFAVAKHCIPLAPHLLFPQFMDEGTERELALFMGIVLLGKCDQVWVFGDTVSEGMAAEIARAKKQRKRIRYFTEGLEEVSKDDVG